MAHGLFRGENSVHEPLLKPKPCRLKRITTSTQYHTANISYYPKKA